MPAEKNKRLAKVSAAYVRACVRVVIGSSRRARLLIHPESEATALREAHRVASRVPTPPGAMVSSAQR